jgi:Ca2+-binding RTX toxin-like protein
VLDGGAGNDTASFASTFGSIIDLAVSGPQSDGTVLINIENVIGSAASDILKGDGGNNWLMGGDGADTLMGRGGDDILDGGGSPADTASYAEAHSGVTVDLGIAGPQNTGEGFDTLIGIENLTGSAFADTLKGDAGGNNLTGGAGDDTLIGMGGQDQFHGGDGIDTVSYDGMTSGVTVDLNTFSFQFINGESGRGRPARHHHRLPVRPGQDRSLVHRHGPDQKGRPGLPVHRDAEF